MVSFTTTEGYIVGGALWANGNLYKSSNQYLFYSSTEKYEARAESGAFFICNTLNPYPDITTPTTPWTEANDPCRKVINAAGKWRLPTLTEVHQLVSSKYIVGATLNGITGYKFGNTCFFLIAATFHNITLHIQKADYEDFSGLLPDTAFIILNRLINKENKLC